MGAEMINQQMSEGVQTMLEKVVNGLLRKTCHQKCL